MRYVNWLIVVLVSIVPLPAVGQAIKPADLVGTWANIVDGNGFDSSLHLQGKAVARIWTFDTNGTYTRETKRQDGNSWSPLNDTKEPDFTWELFGDTLQARMVGGGPHPGIYFVARKGPQLLMWDSRVRREEQCADILQRFDPTKPVTLPAPRASTIKSADLVGTWVGTVVDTVVETAMDTVRSYRDSLTLGADQTATMTINGKLAVALREYGRGGEKLSTTGTWKLVNESQGDYLAGAEFLGGGWIHVLLKDGQLIPCNNPALPVFTRVAP